MGPQTQTDGDLWNQTQKLAGKLRKHQHVDDAQADGSRRPPAVNLTLSEPEITPGVRELLDEFNAELIDAANAEGGDALEIVVRRIVPIRDAGTNTLRLHGSSVVVTFPRESLELSGFDVETELQFEARPGEIRLTEWE